MFSAFLSTQRAKVGSFIVGYGESNEGGLAVNADCGALEIGPRSIHQILNNNTLTFQDLNIGVNNLIGHGGLPDNATHGIENGLADEQAATGRWPGQLYHQKSGQGGSVVSQWIDTSHPHWTTYLARLAASTSNFAALGIAPKRFGFCSLGINDADTLHTPVSTWVSSMITIAENVRASNGDPTMPICFTKWMATSADQITYNANYPTIIAASPYNFLIDTTGYGLVNSQHWDYSAFKLMGTAMTNLCFP